MRQPAAAKVSMTQTFDPIRARTTLYSGFIEAAAEHGRDNAILEDADGTPLTYGRLTLASLVLGGRLKKMHSRWRERRPPAAQCSRPSRHAARPQRLRSRRRRAQFHLRQEGPDLRHPHRATAHRAHLEALRRSRQARGAHRGASQGRVRAGRQDAHRLPRGRARQHRHLRQARRRVARRARQIHLPAGTRRRPTSPPSSSSPRAPRARPKASCSPMPTCSPTRGSRLPTSAACWYRAIFCSIRCRCFIPSA